MKSYSSDDIMNRLGDLYADRYGAPPVTGDRLPGAGSDRQYYRLKGKEGNSVIGVFGPDVQENVAFTKLATFFASHGVNVPNIINVSDDEHLYLQTDLGGVSLFSILHSEEGDRTLAEAVRMLPKIQKGCGEGWRRLTMSGRFGYRDALRDLNYFKYCFLKPSKVVFNEERLDIDFERLATTLDKIPDGRRGFMYRDCQSRNIMVDADGSPWWIDFQGGRPGPSLYDAVSLLWQAKAAFSDEMRMSKLDEYADAYENVCGVTKDELLSDLPTVLMLRQLQVMGAYGFRGLIEHKAHFIESIPGAVRNLESLMREGDFAKYYELSNVISRILDDPRWQAKNPGEGILEITIFSFSYKKGYPDDFSGNGGGFMFDCRGMHNPGRYDRYKPLTGLDRDVRDFLEERGEVQTFVGNAVELVNPTIERYVERGFTSLQIGFGCTGGRHRSVYCADMLGKRIAESHPEVRVKVIHREQGVERIYEPQNNIPQ